MLAKRKEKECIPLADFVHYCHQKKVCQWHGCSIENVGIVQRKPNDGGGEIVTTQTDWVPYSHHFYHYRHRLVR
jgi:hypothetical protein